MQTSGVHILKNLCIFGLFAVFGIMEADSAALDDFVEQEVCARVRLCGVLYAPARSRYSHIPRARSEAPGRSPGVSNKSSGHGGTFFPDEFWGGLMGTPGPGRFLVKVQD